MKILIVCLLYSYNNVAIWGFTSFFIGNRIIPSYSVKEISIVEDTFPKYLEFKFQLNSYDGTLLYGMDKNENQLIIELIQNGHANFRFIFRNAWIKRSVDSLCGCKQSCEYQNLTLVIKTGKVDNKPAIIFECNSHSNAHIFIADKPEMAPGYPKINFPNTQKGNRARLYFGNHPKINGVNYNPIQIVGCFEYVKIGNNLNNPIEFEESPGVSKSCPRKCISNPCGERGICYERFIEQPLCDCTFDYKVGQRCQQDLMVVNKVVNNVQFKAAAIRFSLENISGNVLSYGNKNNRITVRVNEGKVYLDISNGNYINMSIFVMKVMNGKSRFHYITEEDTLTVVVENEKKKTIKTQTNIGSENIEFIDVRTKYGKIGMEYKENLDYIYWSSVGLEESFMASTSTTTMKTTTVSINKTLSTIPLNKTIPKIKINEVEKNEIREDLKELKNLIELKMLIIIIVMSIMVVITVVMIMIIFIFIIRKKKDIWSLNEKLRDLSSERKTSRDISSCNEKLLSNNNKIEDKSMINKNSDDENSSKSDKTLSEETFLKV